MKTKYEWGNCSRCGKEITDNNFGDRITGEEVLVCDSCAEKHRIKVIKELERFRKSKDYNNILSLRKKMLWISEQMGNWGDNADKSCMESITDYDDWDIKELQTSILDNEITLVEELLPDILEEPDRKLSKKDMKTDKFRRQLN